MTISERATSTCESSRARPRDPSALQQGGAPRRCIRARRQKKTGPAARRGRSSLPFWRWPPSGAARSDEAVPPAAALGLVVVVLLAARRLQRGDVLLAFVLLAFDRKSTRLNSSQ